MLMLVNGNIFFIFNVSCKYNGSCRASQIVADLNFTSFTD